LNGIKYIITIIIEWYKIHYCRPTNINGSVSCIIKRVINVEILINLNKEKLKRLNLPDYKLRTVPSIYILDKYTPLTRAEKDELLLALVKMHDLLE